MNCMDCGGAECVCSSRRIIRQLTEACQTFTQGLGDAEGYFPSLGAPKTRHALDLMKQAGVEPVFFHAASTRTKTR